jgi:hypothetical protein
MQMYSNPFLTVAELEDWVSEIHSLSVKGPTGTLPRETHYLMAGLGAVLSNEVFEAMLSREHPDTYWEVDGQKITTGSDLLVKLFNRVVVQINRTTHVIWVASPKFWSDHAYRTLGRYSAPIMFSDKLLEQFPNLSPAVFKVHPVIEDTQRKEIWTVGHFTEDEYGRFVLRSVYSPVGSLNNLVRPSLILRPTTVTEIASSTLKSLSTVTSVAFDTLSFDLLTCVAKFNGVPVHYEPELEIEVLFSDCEA